MKCYSVQTNADYLKILRVTDGTRQVQTRITNYNTAQMTKLEQELFKKRKRLTDAERTLATKTTKAAKESKLIAPAKVAWAMGHLRNRFGLCFG